MSALVWRWCGVGGIVNVVLVWRWCGIDGGVGDVIGSSIDGSVGAALVRYWWQRVDMVVWHWCDVGATLVWH